MADAGFEYFRRGGGDAESRSVFTNRVAERRRFWDALTSHEQWCAQRDPLDLNTPRRNVLNFHGVGGIGKSALIRELERELRGSSTPVAATVIDFEDASSVNVEDLILRIRTAVGELGIRCVAFDFALAYYWSIVHPGTTLDAYTKSNSLLARAGQRVGLSADVESSVMDVVSSVVSASSVIHGSTRLAMTIKELVGNRIRGKHAIAHCEPLPRFLDADTVGGAIGYATSLLAWDMAQAGHPRVVFFLDTFEALTAHGRSTENVVQRICYLFPNALFVIAGRDRIDWARESLRGSLDYVGPHAWPDLVMEILSSKGPHRCMLVGELSEADADDYLCSRLVRNGEPVIPAGIRKRIIQAAEGWPLYLDIAVGQYREALQIGMVDSIDFGISFPALVARIMTDLDHEERRVLRAASLFTSFDEELVAAGAGDVSRASVRRLLERDFVKQKQTACWPYVLHGALRLALAQDEDDDAWDRADWRAAGARILDALDVRRSSAEGRAELAACLDHGLRLAHQFELPAPWLSALGRALATRGALNSVPVLDTGVSTAGDLATLLRTVGDRHRLPFPQQVESLAKVLTPSVDPIDAFWVRSLQADALLSSNRIREAEAIYTQILTNPPESSLTAGAKTMYALTLLKRGAFEDLDRFAVENSDEVNAGRLRGDVLRFHAGWEHARSFYARGMAAARQTRDRGLEQLFRSELALVDGWAGDQNPRRWYDDIEAAGEPWSQIARRTAEGLFHGSRDLDRAMFLLDSAAVNAESFGLREGMADVAIAKCFVRSLHGQVDEAAVLAMEIADYVSRTGTYQSWLDVVRFWEEGEKHRPDPSVQWIGGAEAVARRWRQAFVERRKALSPG